MKKICKFFRITLIVYIVIFCIFVICVVSHRNNYDLVFDNIVVLTGGHNRISYAIGSANVYKPKNIFISGVYEKTTFKDIMQNRSTNGARVILGRKAQNTQENATEINDWIKQNNISEILLITSDYHLPRSIAELRHVNSDLKIFPCAVKSEFNLRFIGRCLKEFHKVTYVYIRNFLSKIIGRF